MWDWDYALEVLPKLTASLGVVFTAAFGGFGVACIGGLVLALLGRSRIRPVRWLAGAFVQFVRSTPLLVQLFFLYFVLPKLFGTAPSALATGIAGLGLHYSTYMSEVFRSGIDGVPKGQWEAARALNFSRTATWTRIVLPQAIPPIIPVMGNYLIVIFKETPLLSAITLVEMLTAAKIEVSDSWRAFEPYTLVGVLFLTISFAMSLGVRALEWRLKRRAMRPAPAGMKRKTREVTGANGTV